MQSKCIVMYAVWLPSKESNVRGQFSSTYNHEMRQKATCLILYREKSKKSQFVCPLLEKIMFSIFKLFQGPFMIFYMTYLCFSKYWQYFRDRKTIFLVVSLHRILSARVRRPLVLDKFFLNVCSDNLDDCQIKIWQVNLFYN